ncbi:MAG: hypothetical protein HYV63_03420 [Candidatus Schekmanbacteria bacterium]|nr:hypothetical protein [Candidatus Schekmanbacteria bacterium]
MTRRLRSGVAALVAIISAAVACRTALAAGPEEGDILIRVSEAAGVARVGEAVTLGIPLPRGAVTDASRLRIYDPSVNPIATDCGVLARWGGPSSNSALPIGAALCDFRADVAASSTATYRLRIEAAASAPPDGVTVTAGNGQLTVDTGAAVFVIPTDSLQLLAQVTPAGATPLLGAPAELRLDGAAVSAENVSARVIKDRGLRAAVEIKGGIAGTPLDVTAVLTFHAQSATVVADIRVENNEVAAIQEDNQPHVNDVCNGNNDPYYQAPFTFTDLSWSLPLPLEATHSYRTEGPSGPLAAAFATSISVFQGASGTALWDTFANNPSYACRLQHGATARASTLTVDGAPTPGPFQHPGWLVVSDSRRAAMVQVQDFWQNFPKTLRYTDTGQMEVGLFPSEFAAGHVLRAGEYKTHRTGLTFGASLAENDLVAVRSPLAARNDATWYASSAFFGPIGPQLTGRLSVLEEYLSYFLDTSPNEPAEDVSDNLFHALERFDEYGYVDYGDIPTDFEIGASPYNVKYDFSRGLLYQFLIDGDPRWWQLARAAVRHFGDIDIQHSPLRARDDARRTWPLGGTYGHGYHDEDARFNPHRNYMNPTHGYAFGTHAAFLYYLLTGDELVLDSALEVAASYHWRLRNTADQPPLTTCTAECNGWADWTTSRGTADPILAFLWAYRVTGDGEWLQIIADGLTFQNGYESQEQSADFWSDRLNINSTNFRSVGEYLLYRRELGEDDANGRAIMQRWMSYLTTPAVYTVNGNGLSELNYTYEGTPQVMHDNWLLSVADGMAAYALLTDSNSFLQTYAEPLAYTGSVDPWFEGDSHHYHGSHVAVNAAGYGNTFRYAQWRFGGETTVPGGSPAAVATLGLVLAMASGGAARQCRKRAGGNRSRAGETHS